jgi:hypothetical protein
MKRFLLIFLLLCGVLSWGTWRVSKINWHDYRPQLESEISQALDAQVKLNGDFSITLYPFPKLEVQHAELHARGFDIYTPSLRMTARLWPLLRGRVILSSAEINQPHISVMPEVWQSSRKVKNTSADSATNIQLQNVKIIDGVMVVYLSGGDTEFQNLNMSLRAPDWHGPYYAAGTMQWRDLPLSFDMLLGAMVSPRTRPLHFTLQRSDTGEMLRWRGSFAPSPFALRGDWGAGKDVACDENSLGYLAKCFLFALAR